LEFGKRRAKKVGRNFLLFSYAPSDGTLGVFLCRHAINYKKRRTEKYRVTTQKTSICRLKFEPVILMLATTGKQSHQNIVSVVLLLLPFGVPNFK
jgi:hypothetical protein